MATDQTTRPGSGFSPEAQARRDRKAEQEARLKAVALDSLDVGRGYTADAGSRALDGGEALAVATATQAAATGRPLRPPERREVRQQTLAEQTKPTRTSPEQWRAGVRAYIAKFDEPLDVLTSEWYAGLSKRAQEEADKLLSETGAFEGDESAEGYTDAADEYLADEYLFGQDGEEEESPPWLPTDRAPTPAEQDAWDAYLAEGGEEGGEEEGWAA